MIRQMKIKIESLFGFLRPHNRDAEENVPAAVPLPGIAASFPYHGVSITPGKVSCQRAAGLRGIRMLSHLATSIPMPGCTMSNECTCRFKKYKDRRDRERRLFGANQDQRHFSGSEQRRALGRRATDARHQDLTKLDPTI